VTPEVRENWRKIRDALEAAGKTDNWYYKRAIAILAGRPDPLGDGPTMPDR
jgi:hypothetical protein